MPAGGITDRLPPCARDHRTVVLVPHLARRWVVLERRSARLVVNTQAIACSGETRSLSLPYKIYGHKAFQITHLHAIVINSDRATLLNTAHTVGSRCGASFSADCGYNPG